MSKFQKTIKPCAYQDPGERSRDPTRDWARLAYECPGLSGAGVGRQWPATGSRVLNTTVLGGCSELVWKEVSWPPLPLPEFGLRWNYREGTQPSTEDRIKDLLNMAPPIRARPRFTHNQSLPSGSFHKPCTKTTVISLLALPSPNMLSACSVTGVHHVPSCSS